MSRSSKRPVTTRVCLQRRGINRSLPFELAEFLSPKQPKSADHFSAASLLWYVKIANTSSLCERSLGLGEPNVQTDPDLMSPSGNGRKPLAFRRSLEVKRPCADISDDESDEIRSEVPLGLDYQIPPGGAELGGWRAGARTGAISVASTTLRCKRSQRSSLLRQ